MFQKMMCVKQFNLEFIIRTNDYAFDVLLDNLVSNLAFVGSCQHREVPLFAPQRCNTFLRKLSRCFNIIDK